MGVDDTAKMIVGYQHVDYLILDPLYKQERFAHLQAMARLWLLLPEIRDGFGEDNIWELYTLLPFL